VSTVQAPTRNAADVLEAVTALAPSISGRAVEIEQGRRLPPDLLDELKRAGAFRMLLPTSHGGLGVELPEALRVLETLAAADGSTGWTVMIGSGAWLDLTGLPRATFDAVYVDGPDAIVAGAINPSGVIEAVDNGYRVTGRWGFASGCEHADWLFGDCVQKVDGRAGGLDGPPKLRIALFSPDEVVIEDTWHVSGLRGTGSHHFHVDSVVVAPERTHPPLEEEHCIDEPIVRIPAPSLLSCVVAGVAIGIARGALDDIVALAMDKVPLLDAAPLAKNPTFQLDLATADTELRAARSLVYDTAASLWSGAVAGEQLTLRQRAHVRAAAVWATSRAAAAVDAAYRAGGGTSVYMDSPLQRRLRDVHAVTQHFLVRPDAMTVAGAVLAGNDIDLPLF
jgi:alkylation response protein AidB-like acyl-CoA dehydrogenase